MTRMTSRERIKALIAHQEADRIGIADAIWEDTLANWHATGLPPEVSVGDYFGFDFDNIFLDASLRLPEKLVEDTNEYTIREDKHGFIAKQWKGKGGALGYLDHCIKTRADWERLQSRLAVDFGGTSRIDTISYFEPFVQYATWEEMAEKFLKLRERERFILLHVYGPFEATWRRHGFEQSLINMVNDPDLLSEMMQAHIDLILQTLDVAHSYGIVPDGLFLVEDMGMKTGTLFSPRAYRRILFPAHQRLGAYLRAHGIAYFMHSDGDIRTLIPGIIESGVQVLQPLEAKIGLDVRELKSQYGDRLTFMGNIDVQKMAASPNELEEEVRTKLAIAKTNGGYIYHSDHSVPPTVTLDNYKLLMQLIHQYGTYSVNPSKEEIR